MKTQLMLIESRCKLMQYGPAASANSHLTTWLSHSRHFLMTCLLVILFFGFTGNQTFALQNHDGAHDPSSIIKNGNTYWIFTTGDGIYSMYSTDLVRWTAGRTPFTKSAYPNWIKNYVPDFNGTFWAPECIYFNGKYHLYYSCSTFGSRVSAIGLATNVTLDPNSPDYRWVDQGVVVSSNNNSDCNAIDPGLFKDSNGKVWMTWGSFIRGIRITEINQSTGKPIGASSLIAGNGGSTNRSEAPYIIQRGSYYYLFINKGACCRGLSSTYYVTVGRSTSPTGPYYDKSGVDMYNNGGTSFITTNGRHIGPGHVGYFSEGGVEYLTYHYYDGDANGAAKLQIANMKWGSDGWPIHTPDWLPNGRYKLLNVNSNLAWDAWGCTGASTQAVAQGSYANLACQQWDLTSVGYGEYKITCAQGGLAVDASGCSPNRGTKIQLYAYSGANCQRWKIERTNTGSFILSSRNGNRVIEVPNASTTAGIQLGLWDYNGNNCQKWRIVAPNAARIAGVEAAEENILLFPNPSSSGKFRIEGVSWADEGSIQVSIADAQGRQLFSNTYKNQNEITLDTKLQPGVYVVRLKANGKLVTKKLVIQ